MNVNFVPFIVKVALSSTPRSLSVVAVVTCAVVFLAVDAPNVFCVAGSAATASFSPFAAVTVPFSSILRPVPSESFTLLIALLSSYLFA